MDEEAVLQQIVKRLDILISLDLERAVPQDATPMANRIKRLVALGLSAAEIAAIIRKPTNYVTATLSQQRKAKNRKGGGKGD